MEIKSRGIQFSKTVSILNAFDCRVVEHVVIRICVLAGAAKTMAWGSVDAHLWRILFALLYVISLYITL